MNYLELIEELNKLEFAKGEQNILEEGHPVIVID